MIWYLRMGYAYDRLMGGIQAYRIYDRSIGRVLFHLTSSAPLTTPYFVANNDFILPYQYFLCSCYYRKYSPRGGIRSAYSVDCGVPLAKIAGNGGMPPE